MRQSDPVLFWALTIVAVVFVIWFIAWQMFG